MFFRVDSAPCWWRVPQCLRNQIEISHCSMARSVCWLSEALAPPRPARQGWGGWGASLSTTKHHPKPPPLLTPTTVMRPSVVTQELWLDTNQLSGTIPAGWQLPNSLQVRGVAFRLINVSLLMRAAISRVCWDNASASLGCLGPGNRFLVHSTLGGVGCMRMLHHSRIPPVVGGGAPPTTHPRSTYTAHQHS